jgi:ribosomal protein S18 acetylase RimI-like enzyme
MSTVLTWREEVQPQDVQAIGDMATQSGVFSLEEIAVAVELAQDRRAKGTASDYYFLLAGSDDALAGYTCFGRIPFTDHRYDLYWIIVNKTLLQRGIASALMEYTEQRIRAVGGKMLYADTSSRAPYAPAHAFYRRQGFAELARLKDFYADGDDKLTFGKRL